MIQQLAEYDGRIAKIEGPARSGKTEILVRRCVRLLNQGVEPESILVVVSSAFAQTGFRQRLQRAAGDRLQKPASRVVVSRALDVCASILDEPAAREATGRAPRILVDDEYLFFLEDLKTLGQKNQRLSNMLSFFYAQWSAFEDENAWLIPGEETAVLGRAKDALGLYGAMLRHEAPYLCGKLLLSEAGASLAGRYGYVLCDDFQNLSRAEQACMCSCARTQVVVCGNPNQTTKVNTPYPSPEGFEKFERVRRGVEVFTLRSAFGIEESVAFGEGLCAAEGMRSDLTSQAIEPSGGTALFVEWNAPEDEMAGLASIVALFCTRGSSARPRDVVVAVPTKRWGRLAQNALRQRGVRASAAGLGPRLGGDPRTAGRHDALSAYVKLSLAANPEDAVAWRAWGGFGNALTNSDIWSNLHKHALETGDSLYETLKLAAEDEAARAAITPKGAALKRIWDSGQTAIARCRGLRGRALAQAAGMATLPEFEETLSALAEDEDAPALCARVRASLASPRFPDDDDLVRIALYENLCGTECACLVMPGMVDGLIPSRDAFEAVKNDKERRRVRDDDRRRLYACAATGREFLVTSTFAQADIETAERSKMKVARVTSAQGKRIALVNRSGFFGEAGDACLDFEPGAKMDVGLFLQTK